MHSSAVRADAEIRGIHDTDVKITAQDHVSPVVDGITSKISALAAAASALVITGGVKDAMFDGTQEYFTAASRSAAFLTPSQRESALKQNDQLFTSGLIPSRAEGAGQIVEY